MNFALGLRDFDVSRHQPHPPGYPVFIALGKLSRAALGGSPRGAWDPDARALAVWSAIFGALAILPLVHIFRRLEPGDAEDRLGAAAGRQPGDLGEDARRRANGRALAAATLTVACPLYWFNASRPLSDVSGLTLSLAAQAMFVAAIWRLRRERAQSAVMEGRIASERLVMWGAFVAAIVIGLRSQAAFLTLPLLLAALVLALRASRPDGVSAPRISRRRWRMRLALRVAGAFGIGALLWAVPLVVHSGGLGRYLALLGQQGLEDISGVTMLATSPTPRHAAFALIRTFVQPWGIAPLGTVVVALGLIGSIVLLVRSRWTVVLIALAVGPYMLLHLAFHETITTRYALPLVPYIAYLAVRGAQALTPRGMPIVVSVLAAASVAIAAPALALYARPPSPSAAVLADVRQRASAGNGAVLAMHHAFSRLAAADPLPFARVLKAPPKREWLELVTYWRGGGLERIWFLADPRRTDLALIDPASRRIVRPYRWPFPHDAFISGVRPSEVDWHEIDPPGWFAGEGWALTPETAGVAATDGRDPSRGPIAMFVRRRENPTVMLIGGRNLAGPGGPSARLTASLDGRALEEWTAAPDPDLFLRIVGLPARALAGSGRYARLEIAAAGAAGGPAPPVFIDQFDLQPTDRVVYGFDGGWHRNEYNPDTGRRWRWSSARADVRLHDVGRDLTVRIAGESPLRYFDAAPHVVVRAGASRLREFAPESDFSIDVYVPLAVLRQAGGLVTLETDRTFVPDEMSHNGDRRQLGLRIYELRVY